MKAINISICNEQETRLASRKSFFIRQKGRETSLVNIYNIWLWDRQAFTTSSSWTWEMKTQRN